MGERAGGSRPVRAARNLVTCSQRARARSARAAHSGMVSATAALCSTALLMMDAPAISAASPAAASPARIWPTIATAECAPASLGMAAKAKTAASRTWAAHSALFVRALWALCVPPVSPSTLPVVVLVMLIAISSGLVPGARAALRRVSGTGSALLQLGEQLRQSLIGVTGATFHARGDHRVTVLDRLEGRDRAH